MLALRRATVQDVERIAAYAREMSEFLMESDLTETKAFIRSFVKEIAVRPGRATIHYTIPTPPDNAIDGSDIAEIALGRQVRKSVTPWWGRGDSNSHAARAHDPKSCASAVPPLPHDVYRIALSTGDADDGDGGGGAGGASLREAQDAPRRT